MNILIADDHLSSTKFVGEMCAEIWPEADVLAVHTIDEALLVLKDQDFALAISDLGFEGQKDFRFIAAAADLGIPVYVYTDFVNPFTLGEAARAGARAYFAKSSIDTHLRQAIANLHHPDRIPFSCPITRRRLDKVPHPEIPAIDIDPKERAILDAGARGLTPREIADETGLAYSTVRSYIRDLVHRNGVRIEKLQEYWRLLTRSD